MAVESHCCQVIVKSLNLHAIKRGKAQMIIDNMVLPVPTVCPVLKPPLLSIAILFRLRRNISVLNEELGSGLRALHAEFTF